jgi:uncharacterized protein (DUF1015 family)
LGQSLDGDDAERNRYSRAAEYFGRWQADKVLVRDLIPGLYLYRQTFQLDRVGELTRDAVIALLHLEEFDRGSVLPHERTISGPKEDRLRLMLACRANLSPIFGVYLGAPFRFNQVLAEQEAAPAIDLLDSDRVGHRVWICQDRTVINSITRRLEGTPILIADGHHRYETALAFRDIMRAEDRGDPALTGLRPYNYIMMALVSADDPGLVILPIHRLLKHLAGGNPKAYLALLSPRFAVDRVAVPGDPAAIAAALLDHLRDTGAGPHRFGFYAGGQDGYLLSLADERVLNVEPSEGTPAVYRRLDVMIVHTYLIDDPSRRHGQPPPGEDAIAYTHDAVEAVRTVQQGRWAATLLLNPTRIAQVREVAMAGLRMPPKSTFFYPKLLTGLVINPIIPNEIIEA